MKTDINRSGLQWGRIRDAQRVVPFSRSQYYNLIQQGRVESRRIGGGRFIYIPGLLEMAKQAPTRPPRKVSERMRTRQRASAEARAAKRAVKEVGMT